VDEHNDSDPSSVHYPDRATLVWMVRQNVDTHDFCREEQVLPLLNKEFGVDLACHFYSMWCSDYGRRVWLVSNVPNPHRSTIPVARESTHGTVFYTAGIQFTPSGVVLDEPGASGTPRFIDLRSRTEHHHLTVVFIPLRDRMALLLDRIKFLLREELSRRTGRAYH
jgi:hypothetical protein